jgi:hypothetical protein
MEYISVAAMVEQSVHNWVEKTASCLVQQLDHLSVVESAAKMVAHLVY